MFEEIAELTDTLDNSPSYSARLTLDAMLSELSGSCSHGEGIAFCENCGLGGEE